MAMRAGCANAFALEASPFCASVKRSALVIPILFIRTSQ